MKVAWTEHKTNEEIRKMVETERKIMDTVRSRQKRWLGHILLRRTKDVRPGQVYRWSQLRWKPAIWQSTTERVRYFTAIEHVYEAAYGHVY